MLIDILCFSVKNLGRKKSRSFLTVLGIAIGVASVVIIASIGDIGTFIINNELSSLGIRGVILSNNKKTAGSELTASDLELVRQNGNIDSAIPIIFDYTKCHMRELTLDNVIWGIDYGADQVISLGAIHGRLITKNDVQTARKICVIDQSIARAFYKRDNIVGKTMYLQFSGGMEEFEIVGVVASGGNLMQGLIGGILPSFVYIPYTSMQKISGKTSYDQIAVRTREGVDPKIAGASLVSALSRNSGSDRNSYKVDNMADQIEKLNKVMDTTTIVLSLIAGVSLIVAGLSIMTTMLVSVNERTREIGIKKSIGAKRKNIMAEFLVETFSISLVGSLSGTFLGIVIVFLGCAPFGIPIRINPELIMFCVLFAVAISTAFGVYPASVAAKLRPVDALRFE